MPAHSYQTLSTSGQFFPWDRFIWMSWELLQRFCVSFSANLGKNTLFCFCLKSCVKRRRRPPEGAGAVRFRRTSFHFQNKRSMRSQIKTLKFKSPILPKFVDIWMVLWIRIMEFGFTVKIWNVLVSVLVKISEKTLFFFLQKNIFLGLQVTISGSATFQPNKYF